MFDRPARRTIMQSRLLTGASLPYSPLFSACTYAFCGWTTLPNPRPARRSSRASGRRTTTAAGESRQIGQTDHTMGNTSASQRDRPESVPRAAAKDLDALLPALRERFEELAGLPAGAAVAAVAEPFDPKASEACSLRQLKDTMAAGGEAGPGSEERAGGGAGGAGHEERFVMFDDWSDLPGLRGAALAKRLYAALDADGDGRLDFQEFATAACLLKASPEEGKLALLFKMYGQGSRGGFVGREGLKAFILDLIAATPPLLAPPDLTVGGVNGGGNGEGSSSGDSRSSDPSALPHREHGNAGAGAGAGFCDGTADVAPAPDLERELEGVLTKMAQVVLAEYDADNDGLLTEIEWRAYLKREEESVGAFLKTLSDGVEKFLLQ